MSKRTVVLIILDGWGIGEKNQSNPIYMVNPKNINYIKANFLAGVLQASGTSVGLPWGEEGNSEVGHLNIGAGKIIYQIYPKITLSIKNGGFFKNEAIKKAFEHSKKYDSSVNLIGLLSRGNVHSSIEHLMAFIDFAEAELSSDKKENVPKINLHLFTDGRDDAPYSSIELIKKVPKEYIASLSGRFYAMDRDGHWDLTEKAYKVLIGEGEMTLDLESHIKKTHDKNFDDEYVEPVLMGPENKGIKENDSVIFFNFREDRMRQIVSVFIEKDFQKFPAKKFKNLYLATMTQYNDKFKIPVAFPQEKIENTLGEVLADNNKNQFRIAETQKYAHITYFFNGLREEPFKNEYRILIPSANVIRQEKNPEMKSYEITSRIIEAVEEGGFDFILANYANPDMLAHTGDYEACVKTIEIIDEQIGKILNACLDKNAFLIITSDHGNIEKVIDSLTGAPQTQHDPGPVPFYLAAKEFKKEKSEGQINESEEISVGVLADIAPTILELMDIPKPKKMTGQSLIKSLI